jgi:amino acid permease
VGAFLLVNAALGAGVLNYPVAYDRLGGIGFSTFVQIV